MTRRQLINDVVTAYNTARINDTKFLKAMQKNMNLFASPICAYFAKPTLQSELDQIGTKAFAEFSSGDHALEVDRIFTRLALDENQINTLVDILAESTKIYSVSGAASFTLGCNYFLTNKWLILYRLEELVVDTSKR